MAWEICKTPNCAGTASSRGLCNSCYEYHRRHGFPENLDCPAPNPRRANGTGTINASGYWVTGGQHVHVLLAEKALGRKLKPKEEVHHFGEKSDNAKLIICPDHEYHALIEMRQRALTACGNPNYRRCSCCKEWDDPTNLRMNPGSTHVHKRVCSRVYKNELLPEQHAWLRR